MAVVDGVRYEMTVPHCVCGRAFGELLETGHRSASGLWRVPCPKCRDILFRFGFDKQIPRHRLLVIHTIDLETGRVLPNEIGVFKDHVWDDRSETRGGERLPPEVLFEALKRMKSQTQNREANQ